MSFDPNLEEQELLAETFDRQIQRMSPRERIGEALAGAGFVGAVAALIAIQPPHGFAVWPALLCLAVLVAAMLIRIDTRFGFTSPTQLAFVPLVFTMPPALVPVAVAVAAAISLVPLIVRGEMPPTKLTVAITNSWFAVGPVSVFVLAGVSPRTAGPLLLVGALVAQFVLDAAAFALRMVISHRAKPSELAVLWVYVIDGALSGVGLLVAKAVIGDPTAVLALLPLLAILAMFARERHQRLVSLIELNSAYRGTALVLGDVVEADDGYTAEHCKSVVDLAMAVADSMGLDAARRRNLEFGALLHDVGKIAIPKDIINKPGKLDPEEWTVIRTHTIEGQRMLDRVGGFMREVGLIVRSHHERWDGGGYPDRLAGEEIPLEARIIACCDAWNAMRTDRSYRKALSHEVATAELVANVGRQFDPAVAAALIPIIAAEADAESQHAHDARPRPSAQSTAVPAVVETAAR